MKKILRYSLLSIIAVIALSFVITYPFYSSQIKQSKERINTQSKLLETNFGTLEYSVSGTGKPVLLIHGAGGGFDQGLWLGRICLENGYQFIAPSKFGYLNSNIPAEYSAEHQAAQYKILLDHLSIEKVIVIGVSSGGVSSMQFASDYPEMTEKLVLLSAVSMPPSQNDKDAGYVKLIQNIQKSDYMYWLFTKAFKKQMLSLLGIPYDDYSTFTAEQKTLADELLNVMHPMSLRYDGTIIDGLIIKEFEIPNDIKVPALIIHSKNDGLVNYRHAEYARDCIKGSKLILYEAGGHGALSALDDARNQIRIFLSNQ